MEKLIIRDTHSSGSWVNAFTPLAREAQHNYDRYCERLEEARVKHDKLQLEHKDDPEKDGWIWHEMTPDSNDLDGIEFSAIASITVSIEAFLNFYGVKRLGEDFYKENLERLDMAKKAALIIALCFGRALDQGDKLVKALYTIREERNRLVHPKTKEFDPTNTHHLKMVAPRDYSDNRIKHIYESASVVYEAFLELDPNLGLYLDFASTDHNNDRL